MKPPLKFINSLLSPFRKDMNDDPGYVGFNDWVKEVNKKPDLRVLEVGSRQVTGNKPRDLFPNALEYVGVDILSGENVDVVGDVHSLSDLVENNYFDVVYSAAVFEHLMFPWKVALEINKVLKPEGHVLTITTPAWPEHAMPWDFWRFPKSAFKTIFNKVSGFEVVFSEEGFGMIPFPKTSDPAMKQFFMFNLNGVVFNVAQKVGEVDTTRLKWDVVPEDISDDIYPRS